MTTASQSLGSLGQEFVDRLVDGISCFLLGGRAWAVLQIRHDDRRVVVEPASRGRQPTWGGFLPQFLGETICRKIREVLSAGDSYACLSEEANKILSDWRETFRNVVGLGSRGIEIADGEIRWWTFAGGRINSTLRYGLGAILGSVQIIPDNFLLKLRGESLKFEEFEAALSRIKAPSFWEDEELWKSILGSLPGYHLSKFQPLMPRWVEREVIGAYLLDLPGTLRWLNSARHVSRN